VTTKTRTGTGGVYFIVACDGCGVAAEPGKRYYDRQDAMHARQVVARSGGWLLSRPKQSNPILHCPECAARAS